MIIKELELYNSESIHPGFSVDCVIIGFHKGKIKVLLNKFRLNNYWALPGGFMLNEENADQAAYRILKMKTGLTNVFLKQFYLFSDPNRTIKQQNIDFVKKNIGNEEEGKWLINRFVSLGYYALVKYDNIKIEKIESEKLKWFNMDDLPKMYSDHENIIRKAIETIRSMLPIIPIGYELLPEKFTMGELRKIHEAVIGRKLDRRNFQRKILTEGNVIQLNETKKNITYNPPILYSFINSEKKQ